MDFSAKLSTHMVYITTTKRVKQSEKPILTFQNFDFSEFGGVGRGIRGWGMGDKDQSIHHVCSVRIFEDTV